MTDMRDYRNQWKQLQESWAKADIEVNVSATKIEKLEEGKRKLPDALKSHQFTKKGGKDVKADKKPEKDETKAHEEGESEADEKAEHDGKKATESKKITKVIGNTPGKTLFGKKATEGKKITKVIGKTPGKTLFGKKATEDAAPGSAGGATVSAPGAADVGAGTGPTGVARYADRLGCKPGQKCKVKPQERTFPGRTVTGESSGKHMFDHFRKFLEAEGFPLERGAASTEIPEVSPEIPPMTDIDQELEGGLDAGQESQLDSDLLADLQAKFPGSKITVTIEAGEVPFDSQTVEKAKEVSASVSVDDDLEDIGGEGEEGGEEIPVAQEESAMSNLDLIAQETADYVAGLGGEVNGQVISKFILRHHPEVIDQIDMIAQAVKEKLSGIGESIAMGEEGNNEGEGESDVPEMKVGGEVGDEEGDMGGGDLEAGAEDVETEISSDSIALSPEQWEAFLAGGLDDEETPVDVGGNAEQEEAPEMGAKKSHNPINI